MTLVQEMECQDCEKTKRCFQCRKDVCGKCKSSDKCDNHRRYSFCKDCLFRHCQMCNRSICEFCYELQLKDSPACDMHTRRSDCVVLCIFCRHQSQQHCKSCGKRDCGLNLPCQGPREEDSCTVFLPGYCCECAVGRGKRSKKECVLCDLACCNDHVLLHRNKRVCERCTQALLRQYI